jgi:8-oxo-dGTP diphosphatase
MYFGEIKDIEYKERPGAYGLIIRDGLVGVVEVRNKYFLPGGGIENNESPSICLEREILEETGFSSCVKEKFAEYVEYIKSTKDKVHYKITGHIYLTDLLDKTVEAIEEDHEFKWVSPQEAMDKLAVRFQRYVIHKAFAIDYNGEERD